MKGENMFEITKNGASSCSCTGTKALAAESIGCMPLRDYKILDLNPPKNSKKAQRKARLSLATGYNYCYGHLYCCLKTEADKNA